MSENGYRVVSELDSARPETRQSLFNRAGLFIGGAALTVAAIAIAEPSEQSVPSDSAKVTALQNELNRVASIDTNLNSSTNVPNGVITGQSLHLPPSPHKVYNPSSLKDQNVLYGATVELGELSSTAPAGAPWGASCTAVKVSYQGQPYVMTAGHCFGNQAGIPEYGGQNTETPSYEAVNIIKNVTNKYAIFSPNLPYSNPNMPYSPRLGTEPMAEVTGIAVDDTGNNDIAMLKVEADPKSANGNFNSLPSFPISKIELGINQSGKFAKNYQDMALYSVPQISGFEAVGNSGEYLSRVIDMPGEISYFMALVGENSETPQADSCEYGGSGSVAMFPDGKITGPLTGRDNLGYEGSYTAPDTPQGDENIRLQFEKQTGINMQAFNTICGYTLPTTLDELRELIDVLNNPQKTYASPGFVGGK